MSASIIDKETFKTVKAAIEEEMPQENANTLIQDFLELNVKAVQTRYPQKVQETTVPDYGHIHRTLSGKKAQYLAVGELHYHCSEMGQGWACNDDSRYWKLSKLYNQLAHTLARSIINHGRT